MSGEHREQLIETGAVPEREGCPQWVVDICKRTFRGEDCPCWDRVAAVIDALQATQVGWMASDGRDGERLRDTRSALTYLLDACDEYENSGYSGGFHEAKTHARSVLGESR